MVYGAVWSCVTPFPAPGSAAAIKGAVQFLMYRCHFSQIIKNALLYSNIIYYSIIFLTEAASGVFRPVPPFGAISTLPANAIYFGSILGYQRLCCKTLELVRRREDYINEVFGFGMVYPYYRYILNHSEQRLMRHNRIVGGAVLLSIVYANFLA